jgi:hypothetical protein
MGRKGRAAALPGPEWTPVSRRRGTTVFFISEDGTQQLTIDLSTLPVPRKIQLEIAAAVEHAISPLGVWKRLSSAYAITRICKSIADWIATSRPSLVSLAELTVADARMLARSYTEYRLFYSARSLLRHCVKLAPEVRDEFEKQYVHRGEEPGLQPYTKVDLLAIAAMARGLVSQARDRVRTHRKLIEEYRAGVFDACDDRNPRKELAAALEFCDRTGDIPRSAVSGAPTGAAARAVSAAGGISLMRLIHLTAKEAWAFGVLLAALTGMNLSMLETLPASFLRASSPDQTAVGLVRTSKPRRGSKSEGTHPLTAFDPDSEIRNMFLAQSDRPQNSLSAPFGVFTLLIELSEPARRLLDSDRALVYYAGLPDRRTGSLFRSGFPGRGPDNNVVKWVGP